MSKISVRDLKRYLKQRTHDELVADIATLFKKFDAVKEYYQIQLDETSTEEIVGRYKADIKQEFFPARGYGQARLSVARKAITDCKKVVASHQYIAELMLYYVEMGVAFTDAYGDINEPFYNSMESMYGSFGFRGVNDCSLPYMVISPGFLPVYRDTVYQNLLRPRQIPENRMYERAVKLIAEHNLQDQFEVRCKKILRQTAGMGWGFPDALQTIYDEHFES